VRRIDWTRSGTWAAEIAVAALVYFVAASVMTWPAVLHTDEVIIGGGELGGWLWRYWWHFGEVEALGQSDLGIVDKVYTFLSLGRHPETGNILDVLLISWPLSLVMDLPAHYNWKIFLILVVDGTLGYLLARTLTQHRMVALAAGLVAVVNPVSLQDIHGSGLRQVLLWFVLLFPILLDRAERREDPGWGFAAGCVLGLCGAWYWFYGLFAGMFLGLFAVDLLWRERRRLQLRRLARWVLPLLGGAILVGGFFALPYALGEGGGSSGGAQKLPELSFFLTFPDYDVIKDVPLRPSTYEDNVLSSLNRTIMSSWSADYLFNPAHPRALPLVVFLGGVLPAALLKPGLFPRSRFWLVVFTVFYLGTLGPFLKWGGDLDSSKVVLSSLGSDFYVWRLPYTWMFKWVPGMSRMFAPYRIGSLVVVASVALVALGLSRVPNKWARGGLSVTAMVLTLLQVLYRWEIGPVPDDAMAPTMWRAPIKVSAITVPEFYEELEEDDRKGIIELPLEQQQDLLYYYQLVHGWKVYRSWATRPAIPPVFRDEGGGAPGEQMRYLAQRDIETGEAAQMLMTLSREPESAAIEEMPIEDLSRIVVAGNYRYLIVHERGYYLVDPGKGSLLYNDIVRRLGTTLGVEPVELVEMAWFDYPGNEYKVPDGPVYVPWSSQEVNLPDRDRPNRYFMAVFDLGPIHESWEGPSAEELIPATPAQPGGDGGGGDGPTHSEHVHQEMPPGAR
jgi:hypothetical protein